MTKVKATCIHCEVEETVSKNGLRGGNWSCDVCAGMQQHKRRTYKLLFMEQGVYGAALLEDISQDELGEIINELLTVHKGILLGLTEIKEEKAKVVH
ncbi:hypothetical protein HOBO_260 [Bacillus phage Hobo]|uniref:Uncharacterized protein n=2 Tax=Caeruleovirus BM15 TaxID=1985178 RepID=A0A0S2MUV2_9CAUD|nr:hypothetical protein FD732_gp081 [Bacillus phage BM15]ALO79668.1 hypothetical protein BM10_264 [Bacillus phage BM15]AXQ67015.1 hypothetical protein HOBO_260 [Bacillus phage Hobo]